MHVPMSGQAALKRRARPVRHRHLTMSAADHPAITAAPLPTEDISVLAERAYSRSTGADAIRGNAVEHLIDSRENYPAWLDAIRAAERQILFEMYIVDDDDIGRAFAEALADSGVATP